MTDLDPPHQDDRPGDDAVDPPVVEPIAVDLRDYVDFDEAMPSARRAFETDVVAMDVLCLQPQQTVTARTFETADAVYTVLGGQAWVVTDDAEVTLSSLQSILVPSGIPHGVKNLAADPLILQLVMSPPDELSAVPTNIAPSAATDKAKAAQRTGLVERLRRTLGSG